jgi:hypothetical protein
MLDTHSKGPSKVLKTKLSAARKKLGVLGHFSHTHNELIGRVSFATMEKDWEYEIGVQIASPGGP